MKGLRVQGSMQGYWVQISKAVKHGKVHKNALLSMLLQP